MANVFLAQLMLSEGSYNYKGAGAQLSPMQQGMGTIDRAVAKDGAGWGFGLGVILLLSAIAWFVRDLTTKLDPANVAIIIARHIHKTEQLLTDIDNMIETSANKIDRLLFAIEDVKSLQLKSMELGLEMSDELTKLRSKIDDRIKIELVKSL